MALASKQTEASQIALAKETQVRQAREKAKRLEEERKEKERIRLEKDRLAKKKLEDERREKQLLEERQRRQAERTAAAEAARKQQALDSINHRPSSSSRNIPKSNSSPRHRPNGRSSNMTPTSFHKDPEEQRRLEREEKQARARARLFGEPVSAHKKPSSSRPAQTLQQRHHPSSKGKAPLRGSSLAGSSTLSKSQSASSTPLSARQRIAQQFSATERKPLNQTKRDRRTIEEIEQDMKRKKALALGEVGIHSRSTSLMTEAPNPAVPAEAGPAIKRKALGALAAPSPKRPAGSSSFSKEDSKRTEHHQGTSTSSKSRQASSQAYSNRHRPDPDDQLEDEDEDESEDYSDEEPAVAPSIRDEIWKIMGKDRRQYTAKPIFSDDDGSDDMEADVDDVLEEEGRAARLARLEDQREEERLRQHEMEKKKRLMQSRLSK